MPIRPTHVLVVALALVWCVPAAAQDEQPPEAKPPTPEEIEKQQRFADKAADDALTLIVREYVVEAMEGLDQLSRVKSALATERTVDAVLARTELHVAEFAGWALSRADPDGALAEIEKRLTASKSPDATALRQMAGMLSALPPPKAARLLAHDRLLRARNTRVRTEAVRGLGTHRSKEGLSVIIDSLGSKDAALRNSSCVALGLIGDPRAITPLLSKLDTSDGGTAGFAAVALGRIEDDSIFPNVAARVSKGNRMDKAKALVAAARPAHVERLAAMVKGGNSDSKIAACAALGKLAPKTLEVQEQLLLTMLGDRDRWVRAAAFHALGRCATPELAPALAKRMGQKDPERKMYVYEIAGDVRAVDCIPQIEAAMWAEKTDVLRRVAIDAFWRIADPEAITRVEEKIRGSKGKALRRAMEVLGMRANRNGFDLAVSMLDQFKKGSRDQFQVELALDKQTGHFFGPDPAIWKEWIEANPNFFEKEQAVVERAKWREDFLKENKGPRVTPATEESVQLALDYLARHQDASGAFDQQHFMDQCQEDQSCPTSSGARVQMEPIGMSSLCTLSFFGAGYVPYEGRYGGVLARAMEYMLSRQQPNGDYTANDLIGGYNRPIALQAYAEAYHVTQDPIYLPYVQRGVDFLAAIQAKKGGWRYRVVDNANDSSVVAWVLFAAKSAKRAGCKVRRSIDEGSDLVLASMQTRPKKEREDFYRDIDPRYAFEVGQGTKYEFHTGYQDAAFQPNQATTALGLMSRILLGYRRSHPFCIGSANKILSSQMPEIPKNQNWDRINIDAQYPMYFMYYGTLAMHQMGGKYFREWNKSIKTILPGTQKRAGCERGSWEGKRLDGIFGRLYTTAIGAMTLETYYRYAPILQD